MRLLAFLVAPACKGPQRRPSDNSAVRSSTRLEHLLNPCVEGSVAFRAAMLPLWSALSAPCASAWCRRQPRADRAVTGSAPSAIPRGALEVTLRLCHGWVQGSFLPARMGDELAAMQQHEVLKEAGEELQHLYQRLSAARGDLAAW